MANDITYITWHQNGTTYEATWNIDPDVEQEGMALMGMMEAHGWSAELICEFIKDHIDGKEMRELPMVPCQCCQGFPGPDPGGV